MLSGKSLFVETVTGLVQNAEDAGREEILVIASSEANISGTRSRTERVLGDIKPTGGEGKSNHFGHAPGEFFLRIAREMAMQNRRIRLLFGCGECCDELGQRLAQRVENSGHLRRRHARLKFIEQGVISLRLEADQIGDLSLEF